MKLLILFAVALSSVSAFVLTEKEVKSRNIVVPAGRPESRIVNGHDASEGQFPYQVGLYLVARDGKTTWCGGSVLNNRFILTAAHCTKVTAEVTVYLGSSDRYVAEVEHTVTAEKIKMHPDWNNKTLANDVALIEIPFTNYSKKIQPVKLPTTGTSYSTYDSEDVVTTGWGDTRENSDDFVTRLQWAQMNVIPNRICEKIYKRLLPSHLCISTFGKVSTCLGDSGGPLVLQSSGVQIGITSTVSIHGCENEYPAVFSRVTSYLDWIKKNSH